MPYPTEGRSEEGTFVEVLLASVLVVACLATPCLRSLSREGHTRSSRLRQVGCISLARVHHRSSSGTMHAPDVATTQTLHAATAADVCQQPS